MTTTWKDVTGRYTLYGFAAFFVCNRHHIPGDIVRLTRRLMGHSHHEQLQQHIIFVTL